MDASAKIYVMGTVQGVGFRFFVQREATFLGLGGYVKNMPDGSVKCEVEGPRSKINDFIQVLRRGSRFSRVTGVQVKFQKFENKYKNFQITY